MKLPAVFSRLADIGRSIVGRKQLQAVNSSGGGWTRIFESFTGAFQSNIEINRDSVLAYHAVYSCITLIAQDIGKMRPKLVKKLPSGIWQETSNAAYSPVLRKPNRYQNRIKFLENWITSKLIHGNCYALKIRDNRSVVTSLIILDPTRVRVLVADDSQHYYELKTDKLRGLPEIVIVPADEIIHDPMVCLFHPLVGVSPIYACGLGAQQGINIQQNSSIFFGNMSRPSGILTAPGHIEDDTAARVKEMWEQKFGGANVGRTAVLGDGLEYKAISITAEDSQLIEQLKWTAEMVCSCFHVPGFMVGVGQMPALTNVEALSQQYYSQCLQSLIENLELSLDEGLGLVTPEESFGVELDLDALLRMDTATRFKTYNDGITGGWMHPNFARNSEGMESVEGGNTPYMQQQNFALAALARRDKEKEEGDETTDVQGTAMNGAQVTSLQGLIMAAANGEIPIESASAAINAAFPLLTDADISAMINPLKEFKPTPEEPTEPAIVDDPPEEELDDEEAAEKLFREYAGKEFIHEAV